MAKKSQCIKKRLNKNLLHYDVIHNLIICCAEFYEGEFVPRYNLNTFGAYFLEAKAEIPLVSLEILKIVCSLRIHQKT